MKRAFFGFLGYFVAALLALVLLPIGIILMLVFTLVDFSTRLFKRVFA